MAGELFRVLNLDGGGAKGFYTLGIFQEIEGLIGCPLYKRFDLIFSGRYSPGKAGGYRL